MGRRRPAALDLEPVGAGHHRRRPDFVDTATGRPVMSSERIWAVRDRYDVAVHGPRLDFRVAAAMAVALDALQSR